jgi:tetratricopeptide (TPR) repeat protein
MKIVTLILGAVLAAYCSAGILSQTVWKNNEEPNRDLCRLLLCTDEPLTERARQQLAGESEEDVQKAVALFRDALKRDPQNAYRWADLGEAYADAGQKENAHYCYEQVQALAPHYANLLLRAANFYFQIGENKEALAITARILRLIPDYDSVIFSEYTRLVAQVEDVLRYGLPEDNRAAVSWLRSLMEAGRIDDAQQTWNWVAGRGYADDDLAGEYVDFLIRQGRPDLAASVWSQQLGRRSGDYRKSNYLFNGGFESAPSRSPFDWNLGRVQGAEVTRDCTTARSGECSLRVEFAGTDNVDFAAASQMTSVAPGHYCLHASIRTESLTTDQGIRFRIFDAEAPTRLDTVFGQFIGTRPWSDVEYDIFVPSGTRLLQVQVTRQRSLRFDNKIGGTAWTDELSLEPISIHSPQ